MAQGRLTGVSWREWSSEPTSTVSPAGSTTAAKSDDGPCRASARPRRLRIGDTPLAGARPRTGVRVRHHPVRDDPRRPRGHVRVGRRRRPGAPTGGGDRRGVPQRDRRRRPLLIQAKRDGVPWRSLAIQETYRFERDMAQLGVVRPTYEPRSRDYVDEVIALAAASPLERRGVRAQRLGVLPWRRCRVECWIWTEPRAMELARERGGHPDDPDKDDPLDAALWQRSAGDEPAWPSPWGPGRPGWHAECTAMSLATFGPTVDLHVGGEDLAFPHHAYEAAQAEAFTGVRPFARAWMHVGSVLVDGEKMAKSTGNLVYVHDVLDRYPPGALRLLILSRPWSEPWEFDEAGLEQAADDLESLWRYGAEPGDRDVAEHEVALALLDDLDVPRALAMAEKPGGKCSAISSHSSGCPEDDLRASRSLVEQSPRSMASGESGASDGAFTSLVCSQVTTA